MNKVLVGKEPVEPIEIMGEATLIEITIGERRILEGGYKLNGTDE